MKVKKRAEILTPKAIGSLRLPFQRNRPLGYNVRPSFLQHFSGRHQSGEEVLSVTPAQQAQWPSEGTGVTSLTLNIAATECSCRRGGHKAYQTDIEESSKLLNTLRAELTWLSSTWLHFCSFYSPVRLPTYGRGDVQIILRGEKPAFYQLSGSTEEPLVSQTYLGNLTYLSQWKGQVHSFDRASRPVKLNVKNRKGMCLKADHFLFSDVFELASDTAMASRWGLKMRPVFIQGNTLWIAHSVPFQKDLIHSHWGPLGCLDLSSAQR